MKIKLTSLFAIAAMLFAVACEPEYRAPYIPEDEDEQGTGKEFYIYDALSAYKGKPDDLTSHKISKLQLIYEAHLLDDSKDQVDMNDVQTQITLAKMNGIKTISTDIEEWYSTRDADGIKSGLTTVFDAFKAAIPGCNVGNYGVPMSNLNVMRYASGKDDTEEELIQRWIKNSEKRFPAAEVSDVLYPSIYTMSDDMDTYAKDVKTTADYIKTNFPGKKIVAYIGPQFYSLGEKNLQFLSAEQWTKVLEVCFENFDGVVMWCHGRDAEGNNISWSDERVQTIYAATTAFISAHYDDIAVDEGGSMAADAERVPEEFHIWGDLGFTDTPRNLLSYGIEPINFIPETEVSEADKIDNVLPPVLDKIKHVARNASLPVLFQPSSWIADRSSDNPAMLARFASITEAFKAENDDVTLGYLGVGPTGLTQLAAWNNYQTELGRKDSWLRYAVYPCRALRQYADALYPAVSLINDDLDYWKNDCAAVFEEARYENPGKKIYACIGTTYYGNPNKEGGFADMFTPIKEETMLAALEYLFLRCDGVVIYDNCIDDKRSAYSDDLGIMKAVKTFYANHKELIDKTIATSVPEEDDIPPYDGSGDGNEDEGGEDEGEGGEDVPAPVGNLIVNGGFEDPVSSSLSDASWACHGNYLVRLFRLTSFFDTKPATTRPEPTEGGKVNDGDWFHRCNNSSYYWHNFISDTQTLYLNGFKALAKSGTKASCMYGASGYSSASPLDHTIQIAQRLSLDDTKKYTLKFWYNKTSIAFHEVENNAKTLKVGIVSSNGATASTNCTWETEVALSTADTWTECSVTFDLPAIVAANPGKSFNKCAIFIALTHEVDSAGKTVRSLVNIDDVSLVQEVAAE